MKSFVLISKLRLIASVCGILFFALIIIAITEKKSIIISETHPGLNTDITYYECWDCVFFSIISTHTSGRNYLFIQSSQVLIDFDKWIKSIGIRDKAPGGDLIYVNTASGGKFHYCYNLRGKEIDPIRKLTEKRDREMGIPTQYIRLKFDNDMLKYLEQVNTELDLKTDNREAFFHKLKVESALEFCKKYLQQDGVGQDQR